MKPNQLRFTVPALMLTASALLLTGCSGKNEHGLDPKDPQEVVVWHYYNGAQAIAFEEAVTEFNNTIGVNKGILVTAQSKSSIDDLIAALDASSNEEVGAEDMPNIFQCYTDMAVSLDQKGILIDLNKYVDQKTRDLYVDGYVEEGMWDEDGSWKLFPVAKSTEVLGINKTAWDEFCLATGADINDFSTWEGIARLSEDYYNWSGGQSFFGRDAFANYLIIGSKQLGTEIFEVHDNQVTLHLDKAVMRRLWDNFYVPYVKGYYKHVGRYRSDDVKIGEIVCCACSTSGMTYFPKEVTKDDADPTSIERMVLPIPNFEGTDAYAVQQGASMAVSKTDERAEYASVLFLEWFTSPEHNTAYSIQSSYLPVTKEVDSLDKVKQYLTEDIEIDDIRADTLDVALKQVARSTLYAPKGFTNGNAARSVLETSMLEAATADRKAILDQTGNGVSLEAALTHYLSDARFEEWFDDLNAQLTELCR